MRGAAPTDAGLSPAYSAERILIVRPSSLGDVIRTAPAAAALRLAYPQARIDWLVGDAFLTAAAHHPAVDAVIPFPRRAVGEDVKRLRLGRVWAWSRVLREPKYDMAIDLQGLLRSGVLTRLSNAPVRVGFRDAREGGWIFYNRAVEVAPGLHHVDRYFALLRAIGVAGAKDLRIYTPPQGGAEHAAGPLAGRRYVLLAPTSRGASRVWPMERYAALARGLLAARAELKFDALAVVGLKGERAMCGPLLKAGGEFPGAFVDLVGATSLAGLMAAVEHAALLVCNDSAALHMGVAFGRPLVALFGPTDVAVAGPYGRAEDVISHRRAGERVRHRDPASVELMHRIGVDEVLAAARARLLG